MNLARGLFSGKVLFERVSVTLPDGSRSVAPMTPSLKFLNLLLIGFLRFFKYFWPLKKSSTSGGGDVLLAASRTASASLSANLAKFSNIRLLATLLIFCKASGEVAFGSGMTSPDNGSIIKPSCGLTFPIRVPPKYFWKPILP